MKTMISILLTTLMTSSAFAQTLAVELELGRYEGLDQFGQACSLQITTGADQEKFDSFTFMNQGFRYTVWLTTPQTSTPGTLKHKTQLMFDSYSGGRMNYRSIIGAPIFGSMIGTEFEVRYENGKPTSVTLTKTKKGLFGTRKTTELCNRLEK